METRRLTAGLIVLACVIGRDDLRACGDKFLVPSRGTRFELSPSTRQQAAVLMYANPGSPLAATLAKLSVEPTLRKAGYRPTIIGSKGDLGQAVRRGGWDVVLIDVADGSLVRDDATATGTLVLAVARNLTSPEMAQAKKEYTVVLRSPNRSQAFVDAIDEIVALRREAQANAAKRAHR